MAKTNPIGVRFDKDLLKVLEEDNLATSPQKALNLYEKHYKASENNNRIDLKEVIEKSILFKKKKDIKDKVPGDKVEMPKGLGLAEQIEWRANNQH